MRRADAHRLGYERSYFSGKSLDYLAGTLARVTGVRRILEAKLFFPGEYPDVLTEEAQQLVACAV
jgi:haloalkane dehalogenase